VGPDLEYLLKIFFGRFSIAFLTPVSILPRPSFILMLFKHINVMKLLFSTPFQLLHLLSFAFPFSFLYLIWSISQVCNIRIPSLFILLIFLIFCSERLKELEQQDFFPSQNVFPPNMIAFLMAIPLPYQPRKLHVYCLIKPALPLPLCPSATLLSCFFLQKITVAPLWLRYSYPSATFFPPSKVVFCLFSHPNVCRFYSPPPWLTHSRLMWLNVVLSLFSL